MRFFIKLIIGMLLFNGFIALLTPFFPSSAYHAEDLSKDFSGYQLTEKRDMLSVVRDALMNPTSLIVFTTIMITAIGIGAISGLGQQAGPFLGLSLTIAFISSLYVGTISIFNSIMSYNIYTQGLFSIITIIIGVLAVISFAQWLSGRSDI